LTPARLCEADEKGGEAAGEQKASSEDHVCGWTGETRIHSGPVSSSIRFLRGSSAKRRGYRCARGAGGGLAQPLAAGMPASGEEGSHWCNVRRSFGGPLAAKRPDPSAALSVVSPMYTSARVRTPQVSVMSSGRPGACAHNSVCPSSSRIHQR